MPNYGEDPNTIRQNQPSPARSRISTESGNPVRKQPDLFSAGALQTQVFMSDSEFVTPLRRAYDSTIQRFNALTL